ncbi:C40 family peptidase [Arthrobacter antibioticus]|uniref:C40 family peptidase n=1 Tax=Arthrobacter sp. H35-MC1 TaxID=3046203 RepID=UPI0024BBACA5|nr:C40 family peptidase [Arthrobacter sp. H35-MC1]MDJ0316597.1 C40 family peptidase [Arthrobacter sp. H35-MC1]
MAISQHWSRQLHLSMSIICTLLASGGFVAAGYVGTSSADAAAAVFSQESGQSAQASPYVATLAGFYSNGTQQSDVTVSFADAIIRARKPTVKPIFDLTDPTANTGHLVQGVNALRERTPEISAELISQVRKDILTAAYQGLGHRYVWGGTSFDNGWDCSGFVQWAYGQAGVSLPRTEQWLPMVATNNPQPGDIVVQNPDGPNHWSHIGIYVGNGRMISALNPSVGTFMHSPADVSSSSSYFTMPAFATADEKAKSDAAKIKAAAATPPPSTPPPATTAAATPPPSDKSTPNPAVSTAPSTGPSAIPSTKPAPTASETPKQPGTTPATTPASAPAPSAPSSSSGSSSASESSGSSAGTILLR